VLNIEVFTLPHIFHPDFGQTGPVTCISRIQKFLVKMRNFSGHCPVRIPVEFQPDNLSTRLSKWNSMGMSNGNNQTQAVDKPQNSVITITLDNKIDY
jgi:hypothetical protein